MKKITNNTEMSKKDFVSPKYKIWPEEWYEENDSDKYDL